MKPGHDTLLETQQVDNLFIARASMTPEYECTHEVVVYATLGLVVTATVNLAAQAPKC